MTRSQPCSGGLLVATVLCCQGMLRRRGGAAGGGEPEPGPTAIGRSIRTARSTTCTSPSGATPPRLRRSSRGRWPRPARPRSAWSPTRPRATRRRCGRCCRGPSIAPRNTSTTDWSTATATPSNGSGRCAASSSWSRPTRSPAAMPSCSTCSRPWLSSSSAARVSGEVLSEPASVGASIKRRSETKEDRSLGAFRHPVGDAGDGVGRGRRPTLQESGGRAFQPELQPCFGTNGGPMPSGMNETGREKGGTRTCAARLGGASADPSGEPPGTHKPLVVGSNPSPATTSSYSGSWCGTRDAGGVCPAC